VSGTNFGNTTGTNFGNTTGTNYGNTSGTNFQNVNSQSLQNLINSINQQGGTTSQAQTSKTGGQQNIGATTQQGTGTQTQTQNVPIPSLIGSAIGGGLTGLAEANATNLRNQQNQTANQQNQAFVNALASRGTGA
jgi:hypothetical protein